MDLLLQIVPGPCKKNERDTRRFLCNHWHKLSIFDLDSLLYDALLIAF